MKHPALSYLIRALMVGAAFVLISLGLSAALGALSLSLIGTWGVTQANLHLAPRAVQFVAGHEAFLRSMIQSVCLIAVAALLSRAVAKGRVALGRVRPFALGGVACGLLVAVGLWGLDAMRLSGAWSSPSISPSTFMLLVCQFLSVAAREMMLRGVLLPMGTQAPRHLPVAVSCAFHLLLQSPYEPMALLNGVLTSLILCAAYTQSGGIASGVLMRFGFDALVYAVLGMGAGAPGAVYTSYPSQLTWLSGGANAPMSGLMMTAVLAIACMYVIMRYRTQGGQAHGRKTPG